MWKDGGEIPRREALEAHGSTQLRADEGRRGELWPRVRAKSWRRTPGEGALLVFVLSLCGSLGLQPASGTVQPDGEGGAVFDDNSGSQYASGSGDGSGTGDSFPWKLLWARSRVSSGPPSRQACSMNMDSAAQAILVFGGYGARTETDFLHDTWRFDLTNNVWAEIVPPDDVVPPPRASASTAFDNNERVMYVFGGADRPPSGTSLVDLNDLWALDAVNGVWERMEPVTDVVPTARNEAVAGFRGRSFFIFGGVSTADQTLTALGDMWQFHVDKREWREIHAAYRPIARFSHTGCMVRPIPGAARAMDDDAVSVLDAAIRSRRLRSGNAAALLPRAPRGSRGSGVRTQQSPLFSVLDLATDVVGGNVSATPARGRRRLNHDSSAFLDDDDDSSVTWDTPLVFTIFAGRYLDSSWHMLNDMWSFRFDDTADDFGMADEWAAGQWVRQRIGGAAFSRSYHSMTPHPGSVSVFGGYVRLTEGPGGDDVGYVFNDLLNTNIPTEGSLWRKVITEDQNAPTVRFDHSAVSDGNMMYVYGGRFQNLEMGLYAINISETTWRDVRETDFTAGAAVDNFFASAHFMVAVLTMMLLCFCTFLVSVRRHATARRFGGDEWANPAVEQPAQSRGVSNSVIRELPLVKYEVVPQDTASAAEAGAGGTAEGAAGQAGGGGGGVGGMSVPGTPTAEAAFVGQQTTCSICLCDYEPGEQLNQLPCKHRYHPACIQQWLKVNQACPLCKANVTKGHEREQYDSLYM